MPHDSIQCKGHVPCKMSSAEDMLCYWAHLPFFIFGHPKFTVTREGFFYAECLCGHWKERKKSDHMATSQHSHTDCIKYLVYQEDPCGKPLVAFLMTADGELCGKWPKLFRTMSSSITQSRTQLRLKVNISNGMQWNCLLL